MRQAMNRLLRALPLLLALPACGTVDQDECAKYDFPLSPEAQRYHVSTCSSAACGDGLNPPTSGPHCPTPLSCGAYDTEQPRCAWVHNLEHGHAVFLYNCPDGCPDEVAQLKKAAQSASVGSNGVTRAVVAPDSQLPKRVAAILWRRVYLADTVDPQALQCLLKYQDDPAVTPEAGLLCAP
jgi:hypothetical protein